MAQTGECSDGSYKKFAAAKGVIIAAGDYSGNPEMVFALNDEYRDFIQARGQDYTEIVGNGRTGDGQRLGCWAGGRMEPGPRASMGRAMGGPPPWARSSARPWRRCNSFTQP